VDQVRPRSIRRTRSRLWAFAVATVATAVLLVPAAQAAAPPGFFGLNFGFKGITGPDVLFLKKSGAKTVRWTMNWSNIEPSSGSFHWSAADQVVGDLAAQGIRVLPVMWGSPGWVASSAITPPIGTQAQRHAWSSFLRAAIKRYGPGGGYWSGPYRTQHPGKAPLPVNTWQIWNEPNQPNAMRPSTPTTYAKLLNLSHSVIHQADPTAKVMFAGLLSHSPYGANAWTFLDDVYQQPGARNAFDIMALNPYAATVSRMLDYVGYIRHTMAANGQDSKPLWISEVGWGSDATSGEGLQGQREILIQAFNALLQKRLAWHLGKVLWWNFRDPAGYKSSLCSFCVSAGLLTNDFKAKPSWSAFLGFTGG
jgi:polysaccharide biosynthesis protein PslG